MKRFLIAVLLACGPAAALPPLYPTEIVSARGEVGAVDRTTRVVTLRDRSGRGVEILVPEEVFDVSRLAPGSVVEVQYVPASASSISRPGAPSAAEERALAAADASTPSTVAASGRVVSVDRARRELVLLPDGGAPLRLGVEPSVPGFDGTREGDLVSVRFVRAHALSLTPKPQ
ncbi:MAG: hypothetical protein M0D55_12815 [Elusimicrobiota bacterium]|nr:MAG: hypothetical protein M0D55_12815 [Elusimicrobiota bacterium]